MRNASPPSGNSRLDFLRFPGRRDAIGWAALLLAITLSQVSSQGQGVLIDSRPGIPHPHPLPRPWPRPQPSPPPLSYRIATLEAEARIEDQTARVQLVHTFENTGSQTIEARFTFPLPYDGVVEQMTLMVDGQEYPAEILTAEAARKRYEEIVRTQRDPALLEWIDHGLVQTSVFPIPAGARRSVSLRYSQTVPQRSGLTDFLLPLRTARYSGAPLDRLSVRVHVESIQALRNVYSPTHAVKIERPAADRAVISFVAEKVTPDADFRLYFDSGKEAAMARLVSYRPDASEAGYFLLLASPSIPSERDEEAESRRKSVVFVLDRSGSMSGKKMEQAREALRTVLGGLREGDLFNIIAYDSEVEAFRPELQKFTSASREAAIGFARSLFAGGSTNIDGALTRALAMLQDPNQPSYVIFLTDGLPTVGETGEMAIVAHSATANQVRARLFAFGVGYDVNSRLLDRLARRNYGQSEYVRPDQDVEAAVARLAERIEGAAMTDVEVTLAKEGRPADEGPLANRIYPNGRFDLFAGEQAVLLGRYQEGGEVTIRIAGKIDGQETACAFPGTLVEQSSDNAEAFVARLWAMRRVGEIIDQIDLEGKNDELIAELVAIAKKHGILTPYTSFLADDGTDLADQRGLARRAASAATALEESAGEFGFRQRELKGIYQRTTAAPAALDAGSTGGLSPAGPSSLPPLAAAEQQRLRAAGGRASLWYDPQTDRQRVADTVFSIGAKTFFLRDGVWLEASLSKEARQEAHQIERYSDGFFALLTRHGAQIAPYLTIEAPTLFSYEGEVYEVR
jgi:Ca-activated chloride channel homolog